MPVAWIVLLSPTPYRAQVQVGNDISAAARAREGGSDSKASPKGFANIIATVAIAAARSKEAEEQLQHRRATLYVHSAFTTLLLLMCVFVCMRGCCLRKLDHL